MDHNSQMVKASLTKLSDILHLAIPLHLSLFGAKSHIGESQEALGVKNSEAPKKTKIQLHPSKDFLNCCIFL